ncbi:dynamin family protein [Roseovarius aestuariivivens]|uniref:dynamin family protein n=1 Tax=Roseovarius aestuariivivens TaxID=1888910 RepID=UPI001FD8B268|nr:dynamin family protein [Roseovarius aestuariivivens]
MTNDFLGHQPRKTRLALMGEFSAGKSTLSKLFLGDDPLPIKVTATRLPPVLISYGESAAYAVGHDGTETRIKTEEIDQVVLEETRMIRLFHPSDTLEICDLIDMPGISDPSMSSDVWMSVMDEVDSVIWCTQATQAWRQSEAATWEQIAESTNGQNILLVTQVDKLHSERDLSRVMMRLKKETDGLFQNIFPISITEAIAAGDDEAKWKASGAADFVNDLIERLMAVASKPHTAPIADSAAEAADTNVAPRSEPPGQSDATQTQAAPQKTAAYGAQSVIPKRVRVLTQMRGRTERPTKASLANR